MTIRGVGKPVPSQLYLMQLAGLVVEGWGKVCEPSETQIRESKVEGYQNLRRMTGKDFGYDVEQWYRFLIVGDFGLTHPYGYGAMRRFLKKAGFTAPFKKDLLKQLKAEQSHALEPAAESAANETSLPPAE